MKRSSFILAIALASCTSVSNETDTEMQVVEDCIWMCTNVAELCLDEAYVNGEVRSRWVKECLNSNLVCVDRCIEVAQK